jgi:predicted NAD/FAD-dependent oxidoreductase
MGTDGVLRAARLPKVLIAGAGMTGLTAAAELQQAGHEVLVVEKGKAVGGRLASCRVGGATFDYGAQFITARSPRFAAATGRWLKKGIIEEWYRGSADQTREHVRWRGAPAMAAIPEFLAHGVSVWLGRQLVCLRRGTHGWVGELSGGERVLADAALLTPPVPESLALLEAGCIQLSPPVRARLENIRYERCLATMAVLDGPARIPQPGGLALTAGPIAWIADNQAKGISAEPAATIHATAAFSLENWERDRRETATELLRAAGRWLGSNVIQHQVYGWRYARAISLEQDGYVVLNQNPPLLIAGDAYVAPRVEGAALSGWAAADILKQMSANT